jgi:magnesium transporter
LATDGVTIPCLTTLGADRIREHLAGGTFFWLDLTDPSAGEIDQLGEIFGFHPLALEDTALFGQRPKLDDYGDYGFLVFYGVVEQRHDDVDALREVHLFVSERYIVSVHREPLPTLDEERSRLESRLAGSEQVVLYRIVDVLTDTFFPLLAAIEDEIDALEEAIIASPTARQLQRLFVLKRRLVSLGRVVTPQRDLFAHAIERGRLAGLVLDTHHYLRDVEDHLIQISGLIDAYRERLRHGTELYMSTVSHEQAGVMKQLAVVGTIFLPLSFITGFFGMNFGWLVNQGIASGWTFWALGVGSILTTCAGLLGFFRRKGWA